MAKYIECEAAYRFAQDQLKKETGAYSRGWNHAMNVMKSALHNNDALPAADVAPVRHGRWKLGICQECLFDWSEVSLFANVPNYCPNCGALMDKDGEEE